MEAPVDEGRAAVESGGNSGLAYFEFSYPDDADPLDEDLWWDYYPGLGDDLVRIEEMRAEVDRLGLESFAAEYLGQWPQPKGATSWSAIARADWADAGTMLEQPADQL